MVGTELTRILSWLGIRHTPRCKCKDYAVTLDRMGVEWAAANTATVVGWMQAEAKSRHLPFSATAARLLVLLAIWRAKRLTPRVG
jgi:hypothetical protein